MQDGQSYRNTQNGVKEYLFKKFLKLQICYIGNVVYVISIYMIILVYFLLRPVSFLRLSNIMGSYAVHKNAR